MIKTQTLIVCAIVVLVAAGCTPGRNIDRDGRPDFDDNPREKVCCKFRSGEDFVTTRRACYRRNGRPVALVRCRID